MIRVQLAGAAEFAALVAAYAPPRPEQTTAAPAREWAPDAHSLPHRAGHADDGAGRVCPAFGVARRGPRD